MSAAAAASPGAILGFLYTCRLAPDGMYTFDAPAAETEQLYEFTPEEMGRMLTAGKIPFVPDAGPELWASIKQSAEQLTPWVGDVYIRGVRTGRERWVRLHSVPRREPDGSVLWTGIITEITDLKLAEVHLREAARALALSETQLRTALSGAKMLGWNFDLIANRWVTSADIPDFYGIPRGPDYSDPEMALKAIHPDDVPVVLAGRRRAIESDGVLHYEFRGRMPEPDGAHRWFVTHGQVLRDATGKAVQLVGVTTDVTERKQAEAQREAMNRQLLDAQKWESLGVLAGGVAHDFNNILTVILGSAGLARKGLPQFSPAGAYLEQIEQASRRAADLCRQLLAYAGRGQVPVGKTDLNQLITTSAALLEVSASKAVVLRFDLASELPLVSADAGPVRQVLVNLVMNAAEAIGEATGEVVVATRFVEVGVVTPGGYHLPPRPGHYVRLIVSDTGSGMQPNVRARMFDPFYTTKFPGRGLGLAAVLGILRAHNGAISVESVPGRGTTFEVLWPVQGAAPTVHAEPATLARRTTGKALVVDDEMYVREVTASTLEELGYETLLAGDAMAALELLRRNNRDDVHLAVIDVVMPGMSGDQLLGELRAFNPNLAAVLVSGFTDRRVMNATLPPRTEFLQKPFHPEELITVVKRVLAIG